MVLGWLEALDWAGSGYVPVVSLWPQTSTTLENLSGATATATDLIPAGCYVWGVFIEVLEEVTGATGIDVGDGVSPNHWGDNIAPTAGTVTMLADILTASVPLYTAATDVVLTAVGSNFTGGDVRITVFYATLTLGWLGRPWLTADTTLSGLIGATAVATDLIPAGCYVIGVESDVETPITGATGFHVGDGSDPNAWGDTISPALGTITDLTDQQLTTMPLYPSAADVVLTALGSNFTAGAVHLTVYYADLSLPWRRERRLLEGLSGASVTAAAIIPAAMWLIAVTMEVLTTITGPTSVQIGDGTDPDHWGTLTTLTAGASTTLADVQVTSVSRDADALDVVLTAIGGNFTGGSVRITAHVAMLTPTPVPRGSVLMIGAGR